MAYGSVIRYRQMAGDYYRGRWRGDPGFFSGLGKIVKKIGGIAGAVAPFIPGPIGVAARATKIFKIAKRVGQVAGAAKNVVDLTRSVMQPTDITGLSNMPSNVAFSAGAPPGGFQPGTTYGREPGGTWRPVARHPSGAMGMTQRRRPRMNVGNARALRRAFRRVDGFAKLARKTISFVTTHRLKKRGRR